MRQAGGKGKKALRGALRAEPVQNQKGAIRIMTGNDPNKTQQACRCTLAIATVPMQRFERLYPVPEALRRGTLFAALDLPFCPEVRYEWEQ